MRKYINKRKRRARGVSMLFLLIIIPILFAFAAMAVDFGRLLEAHRSLEQAAEEAAQSGATAYDLGSGNVPRLDQARARSYASANWSRSLGLGVVSATRPELVAVTASETTVTVRTRAVVDDLIFLRYFRVSDGGTWTVNADGEATVCLAGFGGDSNCTRPDA